MLARSHDVVPPVGEGGWTEAEQAVAAAFADPDWVGWYAINASVWSRKGSRPSRRPGGPARVRQSAREGEYEVDALVFTPKLMVVVEAKYPAGQRGTLWVPRDGDWSFGPEPGLLPVRFQSDSAAARNPRKQLRAYCSSIGPRVRVLKPEDWDLRGVIAVHGEGVVIQPEQPAADIVVCTTAPADLRETLEAMAAREPQTWAAWQVLRAIEILELDVPEVRERRAFIERLVAHGFPVGNPPDQLRAELGMPPRATSTSGEVYRGAGVGTREVVATPTPTPAAPGQVDPTSHAGAPASPTPPQPPAPPPPQSPSAPAPARPTSTSWRRPARRPSGRPGTGSRSTRPRSSRKRTRRGTGLGGLIVAVAVLLSLPKLLEEMTDSLTEPTPQPKRPAAASARQLVGSTPYVLRAKQRDRTCTGHVTGTGVQRWVAANPCTSLRRAMFTTTLQRRPVVVTVALVDVGTARRARALRDLVADGQGRVKTLLLEGTRFPGAPAKIEGAAGAVAVRGPVAVFTLADYTSGVSSSSNQALRAAARDALKLTIP